MRKFVFLAAALIAMSASYSSAADHSGHAHNMKSSASMEGSTHEEVIDGVKATFSVQTMKDAMKAMGMNMPEGVKETHHISLSLKDVKSGKTISDGEAKIKLQAPDKSEQMKEMTGMHGHFGADVVMSKKGKYGVMCKFQLKDGKVRSSRFWYSVK